MSLWDRIKAYARWTKPRVKAIDQDVVDRFAADLAREHEENLKPADVKPVSDEKGERVDFTTMALAIEQTFPKLWRQGDPYGAAVYEGQRPVAMFHRADDARLAVEAVNGLLTRDEVDG